MSLSPSRRKYPVVKPWPTVDDCLRSIRWSDYLEWAGATVGSWGYGFMVGRPARFVVANLMAGVGFTFGTFVVVQNARGRLMGFRENAKEIAKYGIAEGAPSPENLLKPKLNFREFN